MAQLPAGMRNNNPGNIKYVGQPGTHPSINTDQGDPQAVYPTAEAGMAAMYRLLMKKYKGGKVTPDMIIAGSGGWTPGNHQAAANVANSMGIGPHDDIGLTDPARAQRFMRALMLQEHGPASKAYSDQMIASAVTGGGVDTAPKGVSLNSTPIGNVVPGTGSFTENVNQQLAEADPGVYGNPSALTVAGSGAYPPAPGSTEAAGPAAPATFGDKVRGILGGEDVGNLAKAIAPRSGDQDQLLPSSLGESMSADAGRAQAASTLMATLIANRKKYGTTLNTPSLAGFLGGTA